MSQTVYVSADGSDRNPGTLERPFRNIQRALRSLPVGQGGNVLIRGGDYVLDQPIRVSDNEGGTPDSRLVISNYQGEPVRIDGTKLAADKLGAVILSSTRAVDIQGLEIFGSYTGIVVVGASQDVRVLNNTVHDTEFTGIAAYAAEPRGISNVRLDGNTVYRTNLFNRDRPITQPGGWGMGITFVQTEGGSITNNTVYENYGEGIGFTLANGGVASNNVVYDNFSVEMYLDNATNSTFANNFIFNTGNTNFYRRYANGPDEAATGIQLANERYQGAANPSVNNVIRNNIVVGGTNVFGYGNYDLGGGLKNVQVINNTFYGDDSTRSVIAIDADAHENTNIVNNIFYKVDGTQAARIPTNISGLNFASNLWFGGVAGLAASPTDVNADPNFFAPGGLKASDYLLRADSPALDRGIGNIAADFFGNARVAGSIDLGASERTAAQPVLPAVKRPANWATDLNGDGAGDVLWHNAITGDVSLWELGNNVIQGGQNLSKVDNAWTLRGLIDLNGDRQAEALWQNQKTGNVVTWQFNQGQLVASENVAQLGSNDWTLVGMGEFNGDDKGDLLWRNPRTQDVVIWLMDGSKILGAQAVQRLSSVSWQVSAMADFNGDGKTDILWQNPQTNELLMWQMDNVQIIATEFLPTQSTSPLWQVVAVSDFNGDRKADLLWQNRQTGRVDRWTMDGTTVQTQQTLLESGDRNWEVMAAEDFVGGAASDIFWYNSQNGLSGLWEMENAQVKRSPVFPVGDRAWKPEASKDMTGDGKADVFWRNPNNGAVSLWQFGLGEASNRINLAATALNTGTDPTWRSTF
jgi:Right handed beta helix region/FG-GAP-like repeat